MINLIFSSCDRFFIGGLFCNAFLFCCIPLVCCVFAQRVIDKAMEIVAANGKSDVITLVKGRVEETQLPVEKVFVIIFLLANLLFFLLIFFSLLSSCACDQPYYLFVYVRLYECAI
jgi:hypothetical protein